MKKQFIKLQTKEELEKLEEGLAKEVAAVGMSADTLSRGLEDLESAYDKIKKEQVSAKKIVADFDEALKLIGTIQGGAQQSTPKQEPMKEEVNYFKKILLDIC